MRSIAGALRRRAAAIGLIAALSALAALGASLLQTKQYTAEASLLFRDPGFVDGFFGSSSFNSTDPTRQAATNNALVSLQVVADLTAQQLPGDETGDDVASNIEIETDSGSDLVSVRGTDPDPDVAAELANEFAETFVGFRRKADQERVASARAMVKRNYDALSDEERDSASGRDLQRQISQLAALEALQTGNAELVQRAEPPTEASAPHPVRNGILGGLLGLLIASGLALVFDRLDRRLLTVSEIEEASGLPLLTVVPETKALSAASGGETGTIEFGASEAFRLLRTRLKYFNVDSQVKSILVTAALAGEGKSTTAYQLSKAIADGGERVVLLEADLHEPSLAGRIGLSPEPGLSEVLTGQATRDQVTHDLQVDSELASGGRLSVILAGGVPPDPLMLLESRDMSTLIDDLESEFDVVVVDSPPATLVSDSIPLMRLVGGVVVVSCLGRSTAEEICKLHLQLDRVGARALGVVANRVKLSSRSYGYGYSAARYRVNSQAQAEGAPKAK